MPKFKPTALKRTRRLLSSVEVRNADSSSDSESSVVSGEFSHIPVDEVPNFQKLTLNDSDTDMDQLMAQITSLTEMLGTIRDQQFQQQQALDALSRGQAAVAQQQPQPQILQAVNVDNLFKIPDPIMSIPKFDGSRKQLSGWLITAENTLNRFRNLVPEDQYSIFVTAVINKIEGKAKDIICLAGNPQTFEEVKEILTSALGDRQELTYYKSQLWQTKMNDNMSIHKYYNKCKEIVQNIKTLAKQKEKYLRHWEAINSFIDEDALAAFLAGLRKPYFGYAQAAGPKDIEAAYAFVCKFKSNENTASNFDETNKPQKLFNKDYNKYSENRISKKYNNQNPNENNNKKDYHEPPAEPMEQGSVRSRLTLNRRQINNNEQSGDDKTTDSESEEENLDLKFCLALTNQNKT